MAPLRALFFHDHAASACLDAARASLVGMFEEAWGESVPADMLTGLDVLIVRQSGVVSRAQALAHGLTAKAVRARLTSGRWRRLRPGVYATFTGPPPRDAQLWAAALYAGKGAALSHETAAELHGFADQSPLIHVTIPSRRKVEPQIGLEIHRAQRITLATGTPHTMSMTSVDEMVLDLVNIAARLDDALGWITRACGRRRTTPDRLLAALAKRKKMRWRRDVTIALGDVRDGAMSPLELRYIRDVERRHGLPKGRRQRKVPGRRERQDVFYEDYGLTVELDGRAFHPDETRRRDQRRDNASTARREGTMRYDWYDVSQEPCVVARDVAESLIRRTWPATSLRPCGPACAVSPTRQ